MKIEKQREVEPLREMNEEIYLEALKDKTLDTYENEIAVVEKALNIPSVIMELPIQAQTMLSFYNDRTWINKATARKTYNDIVESYIASLEDDKWVEDIFEKYPIYDKDGNEIGFTTMPKPECKVQYTRLKTKAISYWNEYNLSKLIDVFKSLMSGGVKDEDRVKSAIIDDALYHADENYRLKSRNQAIKVLGMDKNVQMIGSDVWEKGGGKEFGKHLAKFTGNDSHDLSKYMGDTDNE